MRQLLYDPNKSGESMTIVCFISGSGTNYREIAARNRNHNYLVFTNRPSCSGTAIARENNHEVIELSHIPFLKSAREKYGAGKVPRNCPERASYEQEISRLLESRAGREIDLICLAGFDQWLSDWMVERYYPRILNVHPGDTTRGYDGLYWVPSAKAIIAGDKTIRSTLFFVDKGEDTGPVLVQSEPLDITGAIDEMASGGTEGLPEELSRIKDFVKNNDVKTYEDFEKKAGKEISAMMGHVCQNLQEALKIAGDWKIYPLAVHELIAGGHVEVDGRKVYIDGREMPEYGYRPDESG